MICHLDLGWWLYTTKERLKLSLFFQGLMRVLDVFRHLVSQFFINSQVDHSGVSQIKLLLELDFTLSKFSLLSCNFTNDVRRVESSEYQESNSKQEVFLGSRTDLTHAEGEEACVKY